jgi:endoglucanase
MTDFCAQNKAISANSDVYIGFVGWGAGSFDTTYILSLTPSGEPGNYTDNKLMEQCILDQFTLDSKYAPTPTSIATATETGTSTPTPDPSSTGANTPSSTTPSADKQTPSASPKASPVNNPPSDDTNNSSKDGKSAAPPGAKALSGSLLLTGAAFGYMLMAF